VYSNTRWAASSVLFKACSGQSFTQEAQAVHFSLFKRILTKRNIGMSRKTAAATT
jgi:hypothetical protein